MTYIKSLGEEDAFGKLIADGTTNEANLASHYPFSPERWRLYQGSYTADDSTRIFLQYNTADGRYRHQRFSGTGQPDVHQLVPGADERLIMQTAERFRYAVQYVSQVSFAVSVTQSIAPDDVVRIGAMDETDGYGIEFTDFETAELFIMRGGVKVATETVNLPRPVVEFTRFEIRFNWYNVGNAIFVQTYTDADGEQINRELGKLSIPGDDRGPEVGNLPIRYEIYANDDRLNDAFRLNVGSSSWVQLGNVSSILRAKFGIIEATVGAANTWVPVSCLRVRPELKIVSTQFVDLQVASYSSTATIQVSATAMSPQKTDATGFAVPARQSAVNSAVQQTESITQFADDTGSMVTSSPSGIGGYQLQAAWFSSTAPQGNSLGSQRGIAGSKVKRNISNGDHVPILVKASATGDIRLIYEIEQQW